MIMFLLQAIIKSYAIAKKQNQIVLEKVHWISDKNDRVSHLSVLRLFQQ